MEITSCSSDPGDLEVFAVQREQVGGQGRTERSDSKAHLVQRAMPEYRVSVPLDPGDWTVLEVRPVDQVKRE